VKVIRVTMPKDFNLFLYGDDHEGNKLRHDDGWRELVDHITHKAFGLPADRNHAVDHGDIIEAIDQLDPRYDDQTQKGAFLEQTLQAVKNRDRIKKHIIAILEGNHPLKKWRFGRATEFVCNQLGVEYGTWSCIIEYCDNTGAVMFRHYATHGFSGINSRIDDPVDRRNGMKRALRRQLQNKAQDCVLMSMGHAHRLLKYEPMPMVGIKVNADWIEQDYPAADQAASYIPSELRWYVCTGSFFRTYGEGMVGYAEVAGYDPTELGYQIALVRDGRLVDVQTKVL